MSSAIQTPHSINFASAAHRLESSESPTSQFSGDLGSSVVVDPAEQEILRPQKKLAFKQKKKKLP